MEAPRAPDRRIGKRTSMAPIRIAWRVSEPKRRRRKQVAPVGETAFIIDVSVTGAAIEAPRAEDLFLGQRVRIALGDLVGTVVIRRAMPSPNERNARYGVEFLELDPELADALRAVLEQERPEGLEEIWERAK